MKRQFETYLRSINAKGPIVKRVREIVSLYERLVEVTIEEIFISEYLDREGIRNFESLWLFTGDLVMEVKNFVNDEHSEFDFVRIRHVDRWMFERNNYDFRQATDGSRLTFKFSLGSGVTGILHASQRNCDQLKMVFMKYIASHS